VAPAQCVGVVSKDAGIVGKGAAEAGEKMDVDTPAGGAGGAAAGGNESKYAIGTSALAYRKVPPLPACPRSAATRQTKKRDVEELSG
jgi:hypothetical protein